MKRYIAILLLAIATPALAMPAYLVNCRTTTSVTGMMIYVGTYRMGNQIFTETFAYYCPQVIEVQ